MGQTASSTDMEFVVDPDLALARVAGEKGLKDAFTAGQVTPIFPEQRGILRFCGAGVRLEDSNESFAVDGMILRQDPD
jgi:hypothetical protein